MVVSGGGDQTQSFMRARQALDQPSYMPSPARLFVLFSSLIPLLVSVMLKCIYLQLSLSELHLSRNSLFLLVNPVH